MKEGYVVVMLTSNIKRCDDSTFYWDIEKGKIDHNSFEDLNMICYLCGYSIKKPWTRANQKNMIAELKQNYYKIPVQYIK